MALRRFIPLLVFLSVTAAALLAAGFAWHTAEGARDLRFQATADDAVSRIQARIDQHMALLNATQGFMLATGITPSAEAFDRFADALDLAGRYAGIRAIGYAPLLLPAEAKAAEAGFAGNYQVERRIWPESDAAWRAPVALLSRLDTRAAAIGYDMFSEPSRRRAMLAALESGSARATEPVRPVQSPDLMAFVVYLPLPGQPDLDVTSSISPGRPARGFLFASFRANELFTAALAGFPMLPVAVEIRDRSEAGDQLLFASAAEPAGTAREQLSATRSLTVAGRSWTLHFRPTSAYASPNTTMLPGTLALLGLLLAGALTLLARSRERQYEAMAALHRTGEKSLLDKDLMLQEMKHRIKNSIARVLAISRQTASSAGSIEEFSASFSARLQAMAASQDMLTRSHWQRADLAELLRTELDQVFGKASGVVIDGPPISLDERTTQALGLTFHELATNALKYGHHAGEASPLTVVWHVGERAGDQTLNLLWEELAQGGAEPPEKIGFGTRLIDMNIVRELRGQIDRRYGHDGLKIDIVIPLPRDGGQHRPASDAVARPQNSQP